MAIDLNQLRVFVTVVETGAMTRAAKALKMPISRVSRTISRLEATLGATLITRTTRTMQVSDAGKRLHQTSLPLMRRLAAIEQEFAAAEGAVAGHVRITAPEDIGSSLLAPLLADLSTAQPALTFELICTDERLDLVQSGIDVALRMGKLTDSTLKAKNIGSTNKICVAAPGYLHRSGNLRDPSELKQHSCIQLALGSEVSKPVWDLYSGRLSSSCTISPRLTCNHTSAAITFALAQRGIALVPRPMVIDHIKTGALTHVLPQWTGKVIPVHLIHPAQRVIPPRVRAVIAYLEESLCQYF
ncbi:MAG: LysR family transcriptional regulator [Deltaproteobacteria bacterium]|nr:LysR family transcriptional regulator [Deltaproteobacteria bacterium]